MSGRAVPETVESETWRSGLLAPIIVLCIAVTLAILLDTSGSMRERMKDVHDAAGSFVESLRDQDRALVIAFDDKVFDSIKKAGAAKGIGY